MSSTKNIYHLPDFLKGKKVDEKTFKKWLDGQAKRHVKRDKGRKISCSIGSYKEKIYKAILETEDKDFYTQERMDWTKISKFRKESRRKDFLDMPSVDHDFSNGNVAFKICTWRTNDCKSHLTIKELKEFCQAILRNKKS
jgi:hypothetical protein